MMLVPKKMYSSADHLRKACQHDSARYGEVIPSLYKDVGAIFSVEDQVPGTSIDSNSVTHFHKEKV